MDRLCLSEFEMYLPDLSPYPAPSQYLPNAVNGVIEECLLHLTFEGLSVAAEILTDILQHLCIIGEAAVTTAPFTLQHTHCCMFLIPALLPNVVPKSHLRTEGTAPNGSQPDQPPTSSSPDPLTTLLAIIILFVKISEDFG